MSTLFINVDHILKVNNLQDQDGNAVTGATVEATVFEGDGSTEVTGMNWPVTMTDDGSGNYSVTLEDTLELDRGRDYWIKVDISGGGADDERWKRFTAERRGF